jgi:elongation factor P--beta-lysine ligase
MLILKAFEMLMWMCVYVYYKSMENEKKKLLKNFLITDKQNTHSYKYTHNEHHSFTNTKALGTRECTRADKTTFIKKNI